jgi:adenosylhomocysteine nucleosidase
MAWLIVAAESRELSGMAEGCETSRLGWALDFAERWTRGNRSWIAVANGPGPALSAEAVRLAAGETNLDGVMSTGYCGALAPDLRVGDVFVATQVLAPGSNQDFECMVPAPFRAARQGTLVSVDRVAVTAAEKAALHRLGADVVEMEAAGVASVARELGLPFACVRVVSDEAGEDLPLDFNQYRDSSGRFKRPRIALAGLGRPTSAIPALLRLDRNARLASRRLGEFFVNASF